MKTMVMVMVMVMVIAWPLVRQWKLQIEVEDLYIS
jgi:hypothetical protein